MEKGLAHTGDDGALHGAGQLWWDVRLVHRSTGGPTCQRFYAQLVHERV